MSASTICKCFVSGKCFVKCSMTVIPRGGRTEGSKRLTTSRAYLDHNATTPVHPAARTAMIEAFDAYGNPSSIHAEGRASRAVIDAARRSVAGLTGCTVEDVIFTSCGTEALNIVLSPDLQHDGKGCDRLLMSAGEHPAVLSGHRFGDRAETLPLDANGVVDLDALRAALTRYSGERVMVAIQAANNETGVIQPVRAAADLVHGSGGTLICDAVQAAGKIPCDIKAFGADALAISAHKFGGPKGVGALCFAPSRHHMSQGVVRGGGHERGLSAGTENIVGIAGLGAACGPAERRRLDETPRIEAWRDLVEQAVLAAAPNAIVFGQAVERLPNTVCVAVPGYDAQVLLMNLDLNGVAVSAGSACAAGKVKPSHVLTAMGVEPNLATSTMRISLGWTTTQADVEAFASAFASAIKTMRPRKAA